jgi:hypothetical protein
MMMILGWRWTSYDRFDHVGDEACGTARNNATYKLEIILIKDVNFNL